MHANMDVLCPILCLLSLFTGAANLPPTEPVLFWNFASAKKGSSIIAAQSAIDGNTHDMKLQNTAHITSEGLDCNGGFANTEFYSNSSVFGGFGVKPHSIEAKVKYTTLSQSTISPISLYIASSSTTAIVDYFDAIMLYDKKYIAGSEGFNRSKIPMTGDGAIAETLVNEWIHLVITYDHDINNITIYRNGEQYGDSFSAELMSFDGTLGVLVCIPYFGADSLQGVIAAAAIYDQVLDSSTIEAHYKYHMNETNESKDWDFPWPIFVLLAVLIAIFVACCATLRGSYDHEEEQSQPIEPHRDELEEGIKLQVDVTTDDETNNNFKSEAVSPPEAFGFKSKSYPKQNESLRSTPKISNDVKHVQEVKIMDEAPNDLCDVSVDENITEEKVEEITDEKVQSNISKQQVKDEENEIKVELQQNNQNSDDNRSKNSDDVIDVNEVNNNSEEKVDEIPHTKVNSHMLAQIGNMISLIKVDQSIITPSDTTPKTARVLSYTTPQTAKSMTSISETQAQEYKPVVLAENVEDV